MSAIVAGLLPKIEGFQPIPNAVMIPFMETQSAALAFGFGLNYEYGKRTIRSMSNETFNSLTSEQIAEMSAQHSTVLLNRFIQAVPKVMPAQIEIFKQYVEIEKAKVIQNFALAKWTLADLPGILLGLNIDIKDIQRDLSPSKIGTTITQDASGKVTTTQAPKNIQVELTEDLSLKGGGIGDKFLGSSEDKQKIIKNIQNNLYNLNIKMKDAIRKQNFKNFVRNWSVWNEGNGLKPISGELIDKIYKEWLQQKLYLSRIKAGKNPY